MAGAQDDWRPWLKSKLEKLGYEVLLPDMPDINTPIIKKWVNRLTEIVGVPDPDTYFIGHSIGCQAILRYLEKNNIAVGGALFVAGWFDLKNLEDKETEDIAEPWINTKIDFKKIKKVLPKSTLIISDNDPYGAFEENKKQFSDLGSEIVVLHNAGHITKEDGFVEAPVLLKEFQSITT